MTKIFYFLILIAAATTGCAQTATETNAKSDSEKIDSVFRKHFSFLDAYVKVGKTDSGYQTSRAIRFMEIITDIKSRGNITYAYKVSCSKQDLEAWHKWYEENKNQLVWNRKYKEVQRKKN